MFLCPICRNDLVQTGRTLLCHNGHSFDLAAQGYANLLPSNKMSSKAPGDNAEMVNGRTRFLDSSSYQPLSDALNRTVIALTADSPRILDAGCGEGYYAARLDRALKAAGKTPDFSGVDISKRAVRHAAGRLPEGNFAVASLFELPIADKTIDICYNIFSPICASEFARVLSHTGHFIAVYPAARHLFALKKILYEMPYENEEKSFELEELEIVNRERISYSFTLDSNELIKSLFMMTPYYYKTPVDGSRRLAECERLSIEADFWIVTYRGRLDK